MRKTTVRRGYDSGCKGREFGPGESWLKHRSSGVCSRSEMTFTRTVWATVVTVRTIWMAVVIVRTTYCNIRNVYVLWTALTVYLSNEEWVCFLRGMKWFSKCCRWTSDFTELCSHIRHIMTGWTLGKWMNSGNKITNWRVQLKCDQSAIHAVPCKACTHSFPVSQEYSLFLMDPKVHYRNHKFFPLGLVVG